MPVKKIPEDCLPSCGSCSFFLKQPKDDLGYCRRYPPTIVSLGDDEFESVFPISAPDDWCGEFVRFVS